MKPSPERPSGAVPADPFDAVRIGAVDTALEGIVTVDAETRIVMINPAARRIFGVTAEQVLGSRIDRFIPPRLRRSHADHVAAFAQSRQHELLMTGRRPVTAMRANGEEFPLEAAVSRVDAAGQFGDQSYFTVLLRDLSREQSLKAALDSYRAQMRKVFQLAPVAIWIAQSDRIIFANEAGAALFGAMTPDSLVGRSIFELLQPKSRANVQRKIEQVLKTGIAATHIRERLATLDGTERVVEIAVAPLPDHGQTTVQMVVNDATERSREHEELDRSRLQLRRLAASVVQAREDERRRVARELHDDLGQRLTALKMELSGLGAPGATSPPQVAELMDMIDETVASVRRISKDLRPPMLDDLGLSAALEWLADDVGRRNALDVRVETVEFDPPVDDRVAIAVYRMVQESLTNVARHARARHVVIRLHQAADQLLLSVQDDGIGFSDDLLAKNDSHGLVGIRERAYMLGGDMQTFNAPEGGAVLTVRLPVRALPAGTVHASAPPEPTPLLRSSAALAHELQMHQAKLERQSEELRRTQLELARARETERRRVAQVLHEERVQCRSAIKLHPQGDGGAWLDRTVAARSRDRCDMLDAAIYGLVRDNAGRTGASVTQRVELTGVPLAESTAVALFRILQETLKALVGPSGATEVHIELRQVDDELRLRLVHNARRPTTVEEPGTVWREHLQILGGRVVIDAAADAEQVLELRLPSSADARVAP